MKKIRFFYFLYLLLVFLSVALFSYAVTPDADWDGVPDESDKCFGSQTTAVDQFGCSCEQKSCPSDNNPCTDDCTVINNLLTCRFANNNNKCQGGYCSDGVCTLQGNSEDGGISGFLEILHADDFQNPENSKFLYYLRQGNNRYELGEDKNFINHGARSGDQVSVQGRISGKKIITQLNSRIVKRTAGDSNDVSENIGPQSTLVIVASVNGEQPSADINTARDLVFGDHVGTVNDFYKKNSLGKAYLTGKVVGPYSLINVQITTDGNDVLTKAIKAADPDVNFRDYSRIILDIPNIACGGFGGFGTIGKSTYSTADGDIKASVSWDCGFYLYIVGHELGHNFGTYHANLLDCFDCQSSELERFDIMGNKVGHFNAPHKEEVGWLNGNTIIATEGEFLIKPIETIQPQGSIQEIKLPLSVMPKFYADRGANNAYMTLELRQPIDYDAGLPSKSYSGIMIHYAENPQSPFIYNTNLINYNKDNYELTPLLQVGETFRDNINRYEITLKNIDANGALVSIKKLNGSQCHDSDSGLNYNLSGIVTWLNYTYRDRCADSESLVEYFCMDEGVNEKLFACPYGCKDGACSGPTKPTNPVLYITPSNISNGDIVTLTVGNGKPNSSIFMDIINQADRSYVINGAQIGQTDKNGKWSTSVEAHDWKAGDYTAFVNVAGATSDKVLFTIMSSTKTAIPVLSLSQYEISNGDKVIVSVDKGTPNSSILFYVEDQNGKLLVDGILAGPTDYNGKWSTIVDVQDWQTGNYRILASVAGIKSEWVKFIIKPSIKVPVFDINPKTIRNGDVIYGTVTNAEKNSAILLYVNKDDGTPLISGDPICNQNNICQTDDNGFWSVVLPAKDLTPASYKVLVAIAGTKSNPVDIEVK